MAFGRGPDDGNRGGNSSASPGLGGGRGNDVGFGRGTHQGRGSEQDKAENNGGEFGPKDAIGRLNETLDNRPTGLLDAVLDFIGLPDKVYETSPGYYASKRGFNLGDSGLIEFGLGAVHPGLGAIFGDHRNRYSGPFGRDVDTGPGAGAGMPGADSGGIIDKTVAEEPATPEVSPVTPVSPMRRSKYVGYGQPSLRGQALSGSFRPWWELTQ